MKRDHSGNKRISVPVMIGIDLLCIIVGLNVFALFHHVLDFYFPRESESSPIILVSPVSTEKVPNTAPDTASIDTKPETVGEEEENEGLWKERFADKFTDGEIIQTENTYQSANISVTVTTVEEKALVYSIADIYISDLKYLRSALGENGYRSRGYTQDLAAANNAVVAISGDYYSARQEGVVIRNGVLYRETRYGDVCVLLRDGRMLTIPDSQLDLEELKAASPWQVWSFGPALLENGAAIARFNDPVERNNPRSAIGYVEPGHYILVQVDGRGANGSRGMTLEQLSALFESLGCETAYNLDGGQSAGMAWDGELISYAYGRMVSDIIYITDFPDDEGEG